MSSNRRHAAVPKDQLHVEGDAEFSAEYAEQYKDGPRPRNIAVRQGSHIGPFVCADDVAPEAAACRSEQNDRYVPHPDGRRADSLRPGTGLRLDETPMDGETEQTASYRKYPTTPHPDADARGNHLTYVVDIVVFVCRRRLKRASRVSVTSIVNAERVNYTRFRTTESRILVFQSFGNDFYCGSFPMIGVANRNVRTRVDSVHYSFEIVHSKRSIRIL